ncbi:unnamed protein product, partial [Didymodactylos carnosus]
IKNNKYLTWEDVEFYLLFHLTTAQKEGVRGFEQNLSHQTREIWELIQDATPNEDKARNILTLDQFLDTWGALSRYIVETSKLPRVFEDWIKLGFDLYDLDGKGDIPPDSFQMLYNKMGLGQTYALIAYKFLTESGTKPLDFERVLSIIKALITSSDDEHFSHFLLPGFFRQVMAKRDREQHDEKFRNVGDDRDSFSDKDDGQRGKSDRDSSPSQPQQQQPDGKGDRSLSPPQDRQNNRKQDENQQKPSPQPATQENYASNSQSYPPSFTDDSHIKQILRELNFECDEVEVIDGNSRRKLVLHDHPNQQDRYQEELRQFERQVAELNQRALAGQLRTNNSFDQQPPTASAPYLQLQQYQYETPTGVDQNKQPHLLDRIDNENQQGRSSKSDQQQPTSSSQQQSSSTTQQASNQNTPQQAENSNASAQRKQSRPQEHTESWSRDQKDQDQLPQQNGQQRQPSTLKSSAQQKLSEVPQLQQQYQQSKPTVPLFQQNQQPGIRQVYPPNEQYYKQPQSASYSQQQPSSQQQQPSYQQRQSSSQQQQPSSQQQQSSAQQQQPSYQQRQSSSQQQQPSSQQQQPSSQQQQPSYQQQQPSYQQRQSSSQQQQPSSQQQQPPYQQQQSSSQQQQPSRQQKDETKETGNRSAQSSNEQPSKQQQSPPSSSAQDNQNKSNISPQQSAYQQNYSSNNDGSSKEPSTATSGIKSPPRRNEQNEQPNSNTGEQKPSQSGNDFRSPTRDDQLDQSSTRDHKKKQDNEPKLSQEAQDKCISNVLRQITPLIERLVQDEVRKAIRNLSSPGDGDSDDETGQFFGVDPFQIMFGGGMPFGGPLFTPNRAYDRSQRGYGLDDHQAFTSGQQQQQPQSAQGPQKWGQQSQNFSNPQEQRPNRPNVNEERNNNRGNERTFYSGPDGSLGGGSGPFLPQNPMFMMDGSRGTVPGMGGLMGGPMGGPMGGQGFILIMGDDERDEIQMGRRGRQPPRFPQ